MDKRYPWLIHPPAQGSRSILLLRLIAGGIFFWEGQPTFACID